VKSHISHLAHPTHSLLPYFAALTHKSYHFEKSPVPLKPAIFQHRPFRRAANTATMLIPKADRKKIHEVITNTFELRSDDGGELRAA
jgi:hypothetical protein